MTIRVPFLVTAESVDMPMIVFKVIEQIVSESCFSKMFVNDKPNDAEALVNLIRTIIIEDKLESVRTSKRNFVIPKNKTVEWTVWMRNRHQSYLNPMLTQMCRMDC